MTVGIALARQPFLLALPRLWASLHFPSSLEQLPAPPTAIVPKAAQGKAQIVLKINDSTQVTLSGS